MCSSPILTTKKRDNKLTDKLKAQPLKTDIIRSFVLNLLYKD
jgi:hypothetical protein